MRASHHDTCIRTYHNTNASFFRHQCSFCTRPPEPHAWARVDRPQEQMKEEEEEEETETEEEEEEEEYDEEETEKGEDEDTD